jgi:hypothetical protein
MALLGVVAAGAALLLYDYLNINLWLERDAGRLQNYSVQLIENQQEVAVVRPDDPNDAVTQVDRVLIEEMRRGRRNVVTLSRSEIKYNLFHTRACVKVYLETALPGQPERRSRLGVLCELKREGRAWKIAKPPVEKTIE